MNHRASAMGKHARAATKSRPQSSAFRKSRPTLPIITPIPKGALLGVLLASTAGPCAAQIQWTGAVDDDWFEGHNWAAGSTPTESDDVNIATGAVTVSGGAAVSVDATIQSPAQATVTGATSSWTTRQLFLRGGALTTRAGGALGAQYFSLGSGTLLVEDSATSLNIDGDFVVGRHAGTATITVANGGHLTTGRSFVGEGDTEIQATSLTARLVQSAFCNLV